MPSPWLGSSYALNDRQQSTQRTVNLVLKPLEPGNERTDWVAEDVPGLVPVSTSTPFSNCTAAALALTLAETEIENIYQRYLGGTDHLAPVLAGSYVLGQSLIGTITGGSSFECDFNYDWTTISDPSVVTVIQCTRSGTGSSTLLNTMTVTNVPFAPVPACKAFVFVTTGAWSNAGTVPNASMLLPDGTNKYAAYLADVGPGVCWNAFILRTFRGVTTGLFV